MHPVVSVILPVYNAEKYVAESIRSILEQDFRDFELIVINDGSTDNSESEIKKFEDDRIIYIRQKNVGLANTLNVGIELARGEFIARQDNDDISDPSRLLKQVSFLRNNPGVGLLGTGAVIVDSNGITTGRFHDHPTEDWVLKYHLLFNNPFVHSSVMFRKSVIAKVGLYSADSRHFEDHNLWCRIGRVTSVANLAEHLVSYREVAGGMSRSAKDYQQRVRNQAVENLELLNLFTRNECVTIVDLVHGNLQVESEYFKWKHFLKNSLLRISGSLADDLGISSAAFEKEVERSVVLFKRHYFNQVIRNLHAPLARRIWAYVNRKLLFYRNPHLLQGT